jgi:methionine synthase II (cobalamin-independent)
MFATLLGGLPRPPVSDGQVSSRVDLDTLVELAVRAQEEAGLEPITDGRLRDPVFERLAAALIDGASSRPLTVDGWRFAAALTDRAVKQALPGPYTLGRLGMDPPRRVSEPSQRLMGRARDIEPRRAREREQIRDRERRTMAVADALQREVEALAGAGCLLIEIEERDAHLVGDDEAERELFREAHRRLTEGACGTHLSLSIVGGSAAGAGIETILAAPYASLAVDLIAGPESWNLVAQAPGDRGIVAGVLAPREPDEPKEVLLWAAHYAASTGGRGPARVGLGSAGSYANLAWEAAVRKMRLLGEAARLAELPPGDDLARSVDAASISARRAALGRNAPRPPRR